MRDMRSRSGTPSWLYTMVVASLGIYLVIGGISWAVMIVNGIEVPDSFGTVLATIIGGLVGIVTPGGGSSSEATGAPGATGVTETDRDH